MAVTVAGLPFDFIQTDVAGGTVGFVFKSTKDAFYYNGTTVTKITDADYPATTVRGIAYLDGTYYVMDPDGQIFGSDPLNTPTSWTSLNKIRAQMEPDGGVALARLLNYIVAFGTYTTEFFFDAGNPSPGSPLAPYTSGMLNIGCAVASSVVQSNNQLFFVGVTKQRGRSVYSLTGTNPQVLSTPSVERILNADDLSEVYAFCVKIAGHQFYVLTLINSSITLACDLATGDWKEWTSLTAGSPVTISSLTYSAATGLVTATTSTAHGRSDADPVTIAGATQTAYNGAVNVTVVDSTHFTYVPLSIPSVTPATGSPTMTGYTSGPFIGRFYAGFGNIELVQDAAGNLYTLDPETYQDRGLPIDVHLRTPLIDGGVNDRKFWHKLQVIGDAADTLVFIRYTGDDYQTWSTYRRTDISLRRATIQRLGSDRRRAFELRHTDNTPIRLEALELTTEVGNN
jgi:hypothetical protein